MAIEKAGIKARLMTGTYVLQSNRAKFNQYSVYQTCLLCDDDPEDQEHFLLKCHSLSETRDPFIEMIRHVLTEYLGIAEQQKICKDSNLFVVLILVCTAVVLKRRSRSPNKR